MGENSTYCADEALIEWAREPASGGDSSCVNRFGFG